MGIGQGTFQGTGKPLSERAKRHEHSLNDAEAGLSRPWWGNAWAVLCLGRGEAATEGCRVRKRVLMFSCGRNPGWCGG